METKAVSKFSVQTLRRKAKKLGYELVSPWGYDRRNIGPIPDGWILVPHHSGMSLEEVEEILTRLGSGAVVWHQPPSGTTH